jgi:hypothetical protein
MSLVLFEQLLRFTFSLMAFCFPLTLALFVCWVWTLISTAKVTENRDCHFLRGCFATFITPIVLFLFGEIFANSGSNYLGNFIALASFGFHVALFAFLVKLWPDAINAIIASAAMSGYLLLIAAFVSV